MMKVEKECTAQGSIMEAEPVEWFFYMDFIFGIAFAAGLNEPRTTGKEVREERSGAGRNPQSRG